MKFEELRAEVDPLFDAPLNLVFVYGSLLHGEANHFLLSDSVLTARHARTRGRLFDTGHGYPAMLVDAMSWVHGEVYEVDTETLAQLDHLENYHGPDSEDNDYDRIAQTVFTENGIAQALMYVYRDSDVRGLDEVLSGDWRSRGSQP